MQGAEWDGDRPCPRPAVVEICGVPFCRPCAREQKTYFAIGELLEAPWLLRDDEQLVGMLIQMRRTRSGCSTVGAHEPDAA